jgi:hypothetical protein
MLMSYTLHASEYFMFTYFHSCSRMLDHGHVEPEPDELTELTPTKETNPELTEFKPRCISPLFLGFCF